MKVLIVDDAFYVLKALRDILEAYGHEVHEASDGVDAMDKYKDINPDVVLMDILLPKLDGISTTRSIIEYDSKAKVIAITAVGKKGLEKDCLEAGAKVFITKPFKTRELMNMVDYILKQ
jgi:two-component system chemotaxis response regulator CheY